MQLHHALQAFAYPTQTPLRWQVGNAQAGELFGALLAGFKVEDGTLVFESFGQSGFNDERGEPYPREEGTIADVADEVPNALERLHDKTAVLAEAEATLAEAEATVDEAQRQVGRKSDFIQLEPEPQVFEGVPPS